MSSKKAQGISINTIIIAAIALIVLVVLVMIFTGRLGLFSRGVSETTTCDQACVAGGYKSGEARQGSSSTECGDVAYKRLLGYKWEGTENACCCKTII